MYVLSDCEGIGRKGFLKETTFAEADGYDILCLLEQHGIIGEHEGLLHLERAVFYRLSLWDLLLICEPWMAQPPCQEDAGDGTKREEYQKLREFARRENVSRSYTACMEPYTS